MNTMRWRVEREEFRESFKNYRQAENFRSDLLSAQNKGADPGFALQSAVGQLRVAGAEDQLWWHGFTDLRVQGGGESISVRTPNPWSARASRTAVTVASNSSADVVVMVKSMVGGFLSVFRGCR